MDKLAVGTHLRSRRKALHLTQRQLAEYAGVSFNTIYQVERGQANPTLEILLKLVDTLGLELRVAAKTLPR